MEIFEKFFPDSIFALKNAQRRPNASTNTARDSPSLRKVSIASRQRRCRRRESTMLFVRKQLTGIDTTLVAGSKPLRNSTDFERIPIRHSVYSTDTYEIWPQKLVMLVLVTNGCYSTYNRTAVIFRIEWNFSRYGSFILRTYIIIEEESHTGG